MITRRHFIAVAAGVVAEAAFPVAAMARVRVRTHRRTLKFDNLHTGEKLTSTYWVNGEYDADELDRINYLLRDFRQNEVKPIDVNLLDLLERLHAKLGTSRPFEVISGYRSPLTNAMLHANGEGVAVHSLHVEGKAIDINVAGRHLSSLRRAAWNLQGGGVGYYPQSHFVHVDTGRVRWW